MRDVPVMDYIRLLTFSLQEKMATLTCHHHRITLAAIPLVARNTCDRKEREIQFKVYIIMILWCVDLTGWTRDSVLCQFSQIMFSIEPKQSVYAFIPVAWNTKNNQ